MADTGIPLLFRLFVRGNEGILCKRLLLPYGAVGVVRFSVLVLAVSLLVAINLAYRIDPDKSKNVSVKDS